jgi:hypothetical protein
LYASQIAIVDAAVDGAFSLVPDHACGPVRGVVGQDLRPNNIWETYEKGALMENPSVGQIDIVDPKYKISKTIFKR